MGDTQGEKKMGAGSVININRRRRRWLRVPVADTEKHCKSRSCESKDDASGKSRP